MNSPLGSRLKMLFAFVIIKPPPLFKRFAYFVVFHLHRIAFLDALVPDTADIVAVRSTANYETTDGIVVVDVLFGKVGQSFPGGAENDLIEHISIGIIHGTREKFFKMIIDFGKHFRLVKLVVERVFGCAVRLKANRCRP